VLVSEVFRSHQNGGHVHSYGCIRYKFVFIITRFGSFELPVNRPEQHRNFYSVRTTEHIGKTLETSIAFIPVSSQPISSHLHMGYFAVFAV
jgi:hypothetical protein